jgi:hypothetical protein
MHWEAAPAVSITDLSWDSYIFFALVATFWMEDEFTPRDASQLCLFLMIIILVRFTCV